MLPQAEADQVHRLPGGLVVHRVAAFGQAEGIDRRLHTSAAPPQRSSAVAPGLLGAPGPLDKASAREAPSPGRPRSPSPESGPTWPDTPPRDADRTKICARCSSPSRGPRRQLRIGQIKGVFRQRLVQIRLGVLGVRRCQQPMEFRALAGAGLQGRLQCPDDWPNIRPPASGTCPARTTLPPRVPGETAVVGLFEIARGDQVGVGPGSAPRHSRRRGPPPRRRRIPVRPILPWRGSPDVAASRQPSRFGICCAIQRSEGFFQGDGLFRRLPRGHEHQRRSPRSPISRQCPRGRQHAPAPMGRQPLQRRGRGARAVRGAVPSLLGSGRTWEPCWQV